MAGDLISVCCLFVITRIAYSRNGRNYRYSSDLHNNKLQITLHFLDLFPLLLTTEEFIILLSAAIV